MTWLIGSRLGRYALLAMVLAAAVGSGILYIRNAEKRRAVMKALQAALKAAQARKEVDDEILGMSDDQRTDALSRWMREP